jgi:hypothetical protein
MKTVTLSVLLLILSACGAKHEGGASGAAAAGTASLPCGNAICAGNGYDPRAFSRSKTNVIHFYGDSIHMGWGFMMYDYPSFLNRIDLTANKIFTAEGMDWEMRRAASQDTSDIWADIEAGLIESQDKVLFENAGPHFANTALYEQWLKTAIASSLLKQGVQTRSKAAFVLTTMFDYAPTIPFATYDDIVDSGKSINDVIADVASSESTDLIDWNAQMDAMHNNLIGMGIYLVKDTVHPTPWGNVFLAMSVAKHFGASLSDLSEIRDELFLQMDVMVLKGFNPAMNEVQIEAVLDLMKSGL